MKNLSLPLLCLVVLSLSACQTSSLTQDEKVSAPETSTPFSGVLKGIDMTQSHISFVGKSNIVNHEGKFTTYSAHVTLDSAEPSNLEKATIDATIDVASVKTDADGLNGHLQKEDFFDAEQFPTVSFVSTNILSKKDANQ